MIASPGQSNGLMLEKVEPDCGQMAAAVSRQTLGRPAGRAAARWSPHDQRCGGGTRRDADVGDLPTPDATHWSTCSMAQPECHQSHLAGLRPASLIALRPSSSPRPRSSSKKSVTLSRLYLNHPDKALVLYVDEKAGIQALDRTAAAPAARPDRAAHARLFPLRHD